MSDVDIEQNRGRPEASGSRRWRREHTGLLAWFGWAGIVGPVLFTVTFLVQEVLRASEYSPVAEPVSALEAGPNGWVQQVNFAVFGLLTICFAIGLHRGIRPIKGGLVGPALLFVSGIGLELAAIFPLREDAAGVTYDPGGHTIAGVMFFATSAAGLVALSRRLRYDPTWRGLSTYTRTAGVVALAGFVAMGTLLIPDGAVLHDYAGLGQRAVILVVLFPCRVLLGARLLQVAGNEDDGL